MLSQLGLMTAMAVVCAHAASTPASVRDAAGAHPSVRLAPADAVDLPFGGEALPEIAVESLETEPIEPAAASGQWLHLTYGPSLESLAGLEALAPRNGELYWRLLSGDNPAADLTIDHIHWEVDGAALTRYRDAAQPAGGPAHGRHFATERACDFQFIDQHFESRVELQDAAPAGSGPWRRDPALWLGAGLMAISCALRPRKPRRRHHPRFRAGGRALGRFLCQNGGRL